jgi:hypothetical protein
LAIVTLCLGLQPNVPAGTLAIKPTLPAGLRRIEAHGIRFPGGELSLAHDGDGTRVLTAPRGLRVELMAD